MKLFILMVALNATDAGVDAARVGGMFATEAECIAARNLTRAHGAWAWCENR